jgi:hypothetical protein
MSLVHVLVPLLVGRVRAIQRRFDAVDWHSDRGQATTEYALVLLAAALVGVLVIGWATAGGGAAAIGRLFDSAIESVIDQL